MNRLLIGISILFGLAVLGLIIFLLRTNPIASNPLTLPDGSAVRVIGVTYGTNHLVGPPVARMATRLPPVLQSVLRKVFGRAAAVAYKTTTSNPTLLVWLERTTNHMSVKAMHYFEAFLSDGSGFVSGEGASLDGSCSNPELLYFRASPRRDRVLAVNFYGPASTGMVHCGRLPFATPPSRTYPKWQPEPLPATKRVGDVEVKFEKLSTGHGRNTTYKDLADGGHVLEFSTNRNDGRNDTVCLLDLRSLSDTNRVWRIAGAEVSDATANHLHNITMSCCGYGGGYFTFAPALWPSEPAWKLRFELKLTEGFGPGETFGFQNVPLGSLNATNPVGWTTNFEGVTITLDHIVRRSPNTNSWSSSEPSQARFTIGTLPDGLHLDLVGARTDNGTNLPTGSWNSSNNSRSYSYPRIPLEATTVDFKFAVQRSRWVEFTVKPEVGTARIEYKPVSGK